MWNIIKTLSIFLITTLVAKVKNENLSCKLFSECEARARYEEQLCVGHEWRKPNFLKPSVPIIMTNKSRCYATLKPEFDAMERLETKMYEDFYKCVTENSDKTVIPNGCSNENFLDRRYTDSVDSPISCFIGRMRIERQCGDLKICCPAVLKCSEKRKKSNIINKILDLHKQLKSQINICKTATKTKRRHPHKPDNNYYQKDQKNNEGRLNIRIGNSLSQFDGNELLSNLEQAPKENKKYINHLKELQEQNNNDVFVDKKKMENNISNLIEYKEMTSNNMTQSDHQSSKRIDEYKKGSSTSEIGMSIINESKNIAQNTHEKEDDDINNIGKKILCNKTEYEVFPTHNTKDVNNIILNEWFNNKVSNEKTHNMLEKHSNNITQNLSSKTSEEQFKLSKENNKNIEESLKQKEIVKENNFEFEEHSRKNSSINKDEKGEVSNPFLLLLDKFQKIKFPKITFTTEVPSRLEMITKDTDLTFENVTVKKMSKESDEENLSHFDKKHEDENAEEQNNVYKKSRESSISKESVNNSKESVIKNSMERNELLKQKVANYTTISDHFSSQNSSKIEQFENNYENLESSNHMTVEGVKESNSNEHSESNMEKVQSKLHEIDGLDIMRKEYQNHLQKILALKKMEEGQVNEKERKISFFSLNGARKSSSEERNEELVEMTSVHNNESNFKRNNSIVVEDDTQLKNLVELVKNCKSRYAGAVKILDENTKPLSLKNSFINWKKTLDERLVKVKEDKTINIEKVNEIVEKIESDTNEIAKIINIDDNEKYHDDDILFTDIICPPITHHENYLKTKSLLEEEEDVVHSINNTNYKKSIEDFKRAHSIAYNLRIPNDTKFLTSCDHYVKCRSHINLLLDKCSSLISERPAIPSTESILLSGLNMCGDLNVPFLGELYAMYTKRNMKLRSCLKKHDDNGSSSEICNNKANNLMLITKKIVKEQELQFELGKCFSDVNKLQNKCYQMSKCCPEYEECKKGMNDIKVERRIIYLTAKITENNQNCLEKYERKFMKFNK